MNSVQEPINNNIDANDLWKGIGGHFDSLNQIIHEIIDNSISNFKCNPNLPHHTILIRIDSDSTGRNVKIKIEDTGSGISNINSAFTLGDKSSQQTPLNEHGFGLKHALASANPNNNKWSVYTRTPELVAEKRVKQIHAPFKLNDFNAQVVDFSHQTYPSGLENIGTGTIIEFTTSMQMYRSLGKYGAKDPFSIGLYLKEDLGFIYSGIIKESIAEIQIIINSGDKLIVNAIEPWIEKTIHPGEAREAVDLGLLAGSESTGIVQLDYEFNVIKNREATKDDEKIVYYQANMKSSGVEIRLNGRMIKNNLLTEIWENVDQHNRFNNFLVRINLTSNNKNSLPATRSSKNGFRQGDLKLLGLYNWIRKHCPAPYENKNSRDEVHLFEELKSLKLKQRDFIDGILTVETNYKILKFSPENIKLDMYVAYNNKVIIYKGKKGLSSAFDLYQLKLYWDACLIDGIIPTQAILLAVEHNATIKDLVAMNNSLTDVLGNNYKFTLKQWVDEGVIYPQNIL